MVEPAEGNPPDQALPLARSRDANRTNISKAFHSRSAENEPAMTSSLVDEGSALSSDFAKLYQADH